MPKALPATLIIIYFFLKEGGFLIWTKGYIYIYIYIYIYMAARGGLPGGQNNYVYLDKEPASQPAQQGPANRKTKTLSQ